MQHFTSCVFVSGSRMTAAILCLLLAGPVLLVAGSPVYKSDNGTVPLVLWHGMGEWLCCLFLNGKDEKKIVFVLFTVLFLFFIKAALFLNSEKFGLSAEDDE